MTKENGGKVRVRFNATPELRAWLEKKGKAAGLTVEKIAAKIITKAVEARTI